MDFVQTCSTKQKLALSIRTLCYLLFGITITSVYPSSFSGPPLPSTQRIKIFGLGFSNDCVLLFNDGVQDYDSGPARLTFADSTEIDYDLRTGTNPANWSVYVIKSRQQSNLGYSSVSDDNRLCW